MRTGEEARISGLPWPRIKEIDGTRPVHYEGFGIGRMNPADIDSRMYTNIRRETIALTDTASQSPSICANTPMRCSIQWEP